MTDQADVGPGSAADTPGRTDSGDAPRPVLAPGEWDVFISYSRKDHAFATRLHAALNAYQPPRDLPLPQRRLQAFLDTSDFVAPDYRPAIRRHLKNASKLIVICSPNAVGSRFVSPEIDDFVALHPSPQPVSLVPDPAAATRGDILSIIIDGLPANETTGAADARNAFPEALCRALAMPIAIDYRGFDPRHRKLDERQYYNAWFTLLAGIYGHDRATIEERERNRRMRILRMRAAIAALVAVGLLALSVWALVERQAAIAQRTHAYARQLAAQAQVGLADVRSRAAPAVAKALESVSLEPTEEALAALKTGVKRLEPLPLGRLPLGKDDGVPMALTFSSDGGLLLGITRNVLLLWRAQDRAVAVRHPMQGIASIVGFSPDRGHAAVMVRADDKADVTRVLVLDVQAQKVVEKAFPRVLDCAAGPNGLRALVSDAAGTSLQVVDLITGSVTRELALTRAARLARLAATGDGIFVVDTANEVWSLSGDRAQQQPARHRLPDNATPRAFGVHAGLLAAETVLGDSSRPAGPDGTKATAPAAPKMGLVIVEASSGRTVMEVNGDAFDGFVGFFGGDRFFRARGNNGIDVYDVTQKARLLTVENSRTTDFNPDAMTDVARQMPFVGATATEDGALLLTALKDGRVNTWRTGSRPRFGAMGAIPMPSLDSVAAFDHGDTLGATATWMSLPALFVSPDGRYIASQSDGLKTNTAGGIVSSNPMVRVWDLYRRDEIARFQSPGGMIVAFAPSGGVVATLRHAAPDEDAGGARLELWRLSADSPKVDRSSAQVPKLDGWAAASADGRRVVWLAQDGRLRVLKAETKDVEVIDELRPAARQVFANLAGEWQKKLAALSPRAREMYSQMPPPTDVFTKLDAMLEKARPGDNTVTGPLPAIGALAVSGDGCCVLVALGPLLRLYSLEDRRLMTERVLSDVMPASLLSWTTLPAPSPLLSHDGRAFAVSVDTWSDFEAMATGQDDRKVGAGSGSRLMKRQLRAFSLDSDAPTGTLELVYMATPALPWPLSWPLAIDARGRRVALQQIVPKNGLRQVAVVQLTTGAVELATPGEAWAFDPLDVTSNAVEAARRAAFSSDDRSLVTTDTKPACPSATQTSPATMMPTMVPICPQLTSTVEVWSVTAGHRIAEVSFEFTPGPVRTESPSDASQPAAVGIPPILRALLQTSVLGMMDDRTVIQTRLDIDPVGGTGPSTLVTERIHLDVSWLTDRACARLPADARVIRREDWLRDLPGEAYRQICK
jgi:hypothetical protein